MTDTTIQYYLNGRPIEGWDENDFDSIDIEAAATNLTDYADGDVLEAILYESDANGRMVRKERQSLTLTC